jgi:hypothetical protein
MNTRIASLARQDASISFVRAVTASVLSTGARGTSASTITRREWPDDRDALNIVTKATSSPAATTTAGWAGILAHQQNADFLGTLAPSSVGLALLSKCLQFSWPPGVNSLLIPAIDTSPTKTPWQVEGQPIGVVMFSTSVSAPLVPAKISTIVVLTREILDYSVPSAEALIRLALGESLGQSIDTALLSTAAATTSTPSGIFYNVTPIAASTQTIPSEACTEDIAAVIAAVSKVSGNNPIVVLANPKQAVALAPRFGTTLDVLSCAALPVGTIGAIASNGIASISDAAPEYVVSDEVSLHMDSAAQPIGSVAPAKSMWQTQCIAIRIKMKLTWVVRDTRSIALVSGTQW